MVLAVITRNNDSDDFFDITIQVGYPLADMKTALVLSGGGARAAYQVGALKAIAELLGNGKVNPFPIICGTSAGAINAAMLATHADCFQRGVAQLEQLWGNLHSSRIHRVGYSELIRSTLMLIASFFRSGRPFGRPLSLFDNTPLYHLLMENIQFHGLQDLITQGHLHALCITAMGYQRGQSINFYQGHPDILNWDRVRRVGIRSDLTHKHLMASSALPAIFPPVRIQGEYFGDGAIRQTAPMSAALHLGADKLLVIGVSGNRQLRSSAASGTQFSTAKSFSPAHATHSPSLAQILAQLLNSAFIDSVEEDIDMMRRFNHFIEEVDGDQQTVLGMRQVDVRVIVPSIRFDEVAADHIKDMPQSLRVFLRTIGATNTGGGASLASYLLFEAGYCRVLMEHGYKDCMEQADTVREFIGSCPLDN